MGGTFRPDLFGGKAWGVVNFPHRRIKGGVEEEETSCGKRQCGEDVLEMGHAAHPQELVMSRMGLMYSPAMKAAASATVSPSSGVASSSAWRR